MFDAWNLVNGQWVIMDLDIDRMTRKEVTQFCREYLNLKDGTFRVRRK